ncbi:hypothetical protein FXO37_18096 [Capsicum annuum]|nr:hypothetical protein FXO37_18096 [Capsicum annuum]
MVDMPASTALAPKDSQLKRKSLEIASLDRFYLLHSSCFLEFFITDNPPILRSSVCRFPAMTVVTPSPVNPEDEEMLVPNSDFPVEGPQPMEVATADTASTVEGPQVDDPPSARFSWTIENFSRLNVKKLYSEVFHVGGYKWRILIFPKGNNADHLSMYLDVADSQSLPYGWSRYAHFSLAVLNQVHNKYTVRKGQNFCLLIK